MKTTTYKTTRVTSTTRATRAATPKVAASKAQLPATFEILGDEASVIVDGFVPLPLAQMFAAMTAAYNAGALKI